MPRKPNTTPRTEPHFVVHFREHERGMLKRNEPGPSGDLGGWGRRENWLIENIEPSGNCVLDFEQMGRLIYYIINYGGGGPNQRIRDACIPALRRIGIDLASGWRAPSG